jgi:hypothetical protein
MLHPHNAEVGGSSPPIATIFAFIFSVLRRVGLVLAGFRGQVGVSCGEGGTQDWPSLSSALGPLPPTSNMRRHGLPIGQAMIEPSRVTQRWSNLRPISTRSKRLRIARR